MYLGIAIASVRGVEVGGVIVLEIPSPLLLHSLMKGQGSSTHCWYLCYLFVDSLLYSVIYSRRQNEFRSVERPSHQLKNGTPFGKKTAVPFNRITVLTFLVHRMSPSKQYKKIVYPIKSFDFFVYMLLRWSFSG